MLGLNHLHRSYAILCNSGKAVKCLSIANASEKLRHREVRSSSLSSCSAVARCGPKTNSFVVNPLRRKTSNASSSVADERTQKAIENDEYRDVLRDFARDFGVTEDSLKILDDIKKEQEVTDDDEEEEKKKTSEAKDHCASNDVTVAAYRSFTKDRFKVFKDEDATVIYSHEEEAQLQLDETFFHVDRDHDKAPEKAVPKRGITGVYDIHELVAILKEENLFDIAVIHIPESFHYADYIVLANAKSPKHAKAVSEHIVQFYKKKKNKRDPFVKVEGEKYGSWSAIDMGNIVLHIFLEDSRASYDIESLWLLDSKYDTGGQMQQDDFTEVMQEELEFFNCLQAQDSSDSNVEPLK